MSASGAGTVTRGGTRRPSRAPVIPPIASPRPTPRPPIPAPVRRNRSTIVGAAFVAAVAVCLTWSGFKELQPDSYRLLYAGRWIAEHGLPSREVFTAAGGGRAYVDQQWLAELTFFEVWKVLGYNGLAAIAAGVFGSGYAMLVTLMRRRGVSLAVAIACSMLAVFGALSLTFVRGQVLAVPLFVALLWILLQDSRRPHSGRSLLLVAPVLIVWANVHGSVLVGVALAVAYLGYRAVRALAGRSWRGAGGYAALAALAALTPMATPYGIHVLSYYREMIGNHAVAVADIEWDPPTFPELAFFQFALPLLLAGASTVAAVVKGRRPPLVLIGAVAVTTVAAAIAMRNNSWLAIAAAMLLAETVSAWAPTSKPSPAFVRALAIGASLLAIAGFGRLALRSAAGYESHAPLAAIAATASYASSHPAARVLADSRGASALLWLDPAIAGRVGYDGELEVYPQQALLDWVSFQMADTPDWLAAARGYQVLLGTRADDPTLVHKLGALPGASVLRRDGRGIAIVRR
jgi:hypothetical protein